MRWLWRRHRSVSGPVNHIAPLPDGDTVVPPGRRRSVDLMAEDALRGPTRLLPLAGSPLLTRGQRWRAGGSGPHLPRGTAGMLPSDEVGVVAVRHLPADGADAPAEYRVEIFDVRSTETLISLSTVEGVLVARRLLEESARANRSRAGL